MPLLSVSGPQGQTGGQAYASAVRDACRNASWIDRCLALNSRVEVAVMPAESDLLSSHPKQAKARKAVWTTISKTPRLRWCILTRHPGNVPNSLPADWIGGRYRNVCIGYDISTAVGLAEGLDALRAVDARWRMLHVLPSALGAEEWSLSLDGFHWVVFSGTSEDAPAAEVIQNSCREAGGAFLFHRTDGGESPVVGESSQPEHPFGPDVLLTRPTLPDLQHVKK